MVMHGDIFGFKIGEGCYRHPVSRGQGRCESFFNAQSSPPSMKNYAAPNVSSIEIEKPWPKSVKLSVIKFKI